MVLAAVVLQVFFFSRSELASQTSQEVRLAKNEEEKGRLQSYETARFQRHGSFRFLRKVDLKGLDHRPVQPAVFFL